MPCCFQWAEYLKGKFWMIGHILENRKQFWGSAVQVYYCQLQSQRYNFDDDNILLCISIPKLRHLVAGLGPRFWGSGVN
jgi:hypothetical protein